VRDEILFGMEQLGIAPADMQQRLNEALALVGLSGFEARDPTTLSGGQKQRLAIAALVALRPHVLVLDEPTTDLDPQGRQEIFSLLHRLRGEGHTLILVEHELSAAVDADQVLLLSEGRIVAAGQPEKVLPQIELLFHYGVRPRDVDRLLTALGVHTFPRTLEDACDGLRTRTFPRRQEREAARPSTPEPPATKPHQSATPFLQLTRVTHAYPESAPVVKDVSLSIAAGEFIALLGQNGSGKTTLAKIVSGLLTPSQGQVLLHGQELSRLPLHTLAQEVSYVFQNPDHQLFADTVEEEVAFGPRNIGLTATEIEARVQEALAAVGLSALRHHDPFLLGRGERQRLAVAALLALRPRLLILDEPTTGLDYPEQRQMMELLRALHQQGRTIIIITHAPWVAAEYADRALLMAQGQLLWDGPLRDLCARPDLCARAAFRPPDVTLLGLQFGFTPLSVEECVSSLQKQEETSA
jgi:energy-coupling factor transport system ATP-binding protein